MSLSKIEDSGELLKQLGKIMDRFDSKDFAEEKVVSSHVCSKSG